MLKLRKVKRKALDLNKYSKAIDEAINHRIYAEYWYLDALTDKKWECWIYSDYEAVMPVPLQYIFGIKFVTQPIYCQQLGVFYKEEISDELFETFEKKLHKYRVRAYHFNEENTERYQPKGEKRVNQLVDLNHNYEEIQQKFGKDRLKDIRRNEKLNLTLEESLDLDTFLNLRDKYYNDLNQYSDNRSTEKFIQILKNKKKEKSYTLLNSSKEVIAICIFLNSDDRKILILSVRNKEIEPKGAFAYMIAMIMKNNEKKKLIFDFEGSSIKGISNFNKSFGAKRKFFTRYSNYNLRKSVFNLKK